MIIGDALSAFETAAGLSPAKISLLIRTLLLALTFVWAAWCVYGEIHHFIPFTKIKAFVSKE
jgi:integrating conjugative element protein (TIGR03758 family)